MSETNSSSTPLPRGTVLDNRFRIGALLGAGSFGQVYQAEQLFFGRPLRSIALKLFFAETVTEHNAERVLSDALTILSLQEDRPQPEVSRRLVQVFDMGFLESSRRAFMSMRLIPGSRTLLDAVRRHGTRGMPVDLAIRFLHQILVPLAWMHTLDRPMIHGDLKPDNVLLTADDEIVLTDFGLSARLSLGVRGGAIAYQAPETLNGLPGGIPSDIYALGLIWYELLTGRHPFQEVSCEWHPEQDQADYLMAHRQARKWPTRAPIGDPQFDAERIVPADEINVELKDHPQLVPMLARCLSWSERDRYPHAQELLDDLENYLQAGVARDLMSRQILGQAAAPVSRSATTLTIEATYANAASLTALGRHDEAVLLLAELISQGRASVREWMLKARIELTQGKLEQARKSTVMVQRLAPKSPEAWEIVADVLDMSGQPAAAESHRQNARTLRRLSR